MSRVKREDTRPERKIRSVLHKMGYRFRKNVRTLPGSPDIVMRKYNLVLFVHGCFWHQHSGCRKSRLPRTNQEFWQKKLSRNVDRDSQAVESLGLLGWNVHTIWECETNRAEGLIPKLKALLRANYV